MTARDAAELAQAAAEAVCEASRDQRLVSRDDVLAVLLERGFRDCLEGPGADGNDGGADPAAPDGEVNERRTPPEENADARLAGILSGHTGIASFASLSGKTVYHAPELLSRTYARILDRKGSPVALLAEEIRANSRDYPRPVPVELFEAPPFGLPPDAIGAVLRAMAASSEYQDITYTATSTGAVYLFSTLHLERGYAAFLAERAETLAMNP
jgi:hypothetical protein